VRFVFLFKSEISIDNHLNSIRKSDRHQKASECYRKSLKLNPFLWSSFEALCRLGERVDTSIFCSATLKSSRSYAENTRHPPDICLTPSIESIKDIPSENQIIENVKFYKHSFI